MLFSNLASRDGFGYPGRPITFATGLNGVQSYPLASPGTTEGLGVAAVGGSAGSAQIIRFDPSGFTSSFPLWDNSLNVQWQQDVTLASLRGYLRPTSLVVTNGADTQNNVLYRIRLAIVMQSVSEFEANLGDISANYPINIWSQTGQRQRILWQRDWVMFHDAGLQNFMYNDGAHAANTAKATGNEPSLAACNGSQTVRLKRCGRIVRGRWPVLQVGVQGSMPGAFTVAQASGALTLAAGTTLTVGIDGWLKAYLLR